MTYFVLRNYVSVEHSEYIGNFAYEVTAVEMKLVVASPSNPHSLWKVNQSSLLTSIPLMKN